MYDTKKINPNLTFDYIQYKLSILMAYLDNYKGLGVCRVLNLDSNIDHITSKIAK